jgi:hypothetical protein
MGKWTEQDFFKGRSPNGQKTHEMLNMPGHKGVQVKTTLRFYLTLVRIATIKNTNNNKCWWGFGEKETFIHCWWECKLVQPLWKEVWKLLKKTTNRATIWSSYTTPRHVSEGMKARLQ